MKAKNYDFCIVNYELFFVSLHAKILKSKIISELKTVNIK